MVSSSCWRPCAVVYVIDLRLFTCALRPRSARADGRWDQSLLETFGARTLRASPAYANIRSMIVCVHIPRFELAAAVGDRVAIVQQTLAGEALAIAPDPGGAARVGEVSAAAEAFGVSRAMGLGEALARCPELRLVPGDPLGTAEAWERAGRALEGIGAALALPRAGLAYFEADGLRGLHRGDRGVIAAARDALGRPARIGAGPTRFCALAGALQARSRRDVVVE